MSGIMRKANPMATWREFEETRPEIAKEGRRLLYQFNVGLAFLGTVRKDGGPRVHAMCPVLHGDGIYAFITASPKLRDLRRDPRFAMHSFPCPDNEDEFYLVGTVRELDRGAHEEIRAQFLAERDLPAETWDTSGAG